MSEVERIMSEVERNYNKMLQTMIDKRLKILSALKHADQMVKSGFIDMITPEEFEIIVRYLNFRDGYSNTTVKTVSRFDKDTLNSRTSGDMIKFGDKLVSLVENTHTEDKLLPSKAFVIGKEFDEPLTVFVSKIPLEKFDEKDIKSVNIEELINEIQKKLYPLESARETEERNIKQGDMDIKGLEDRVASLENELREAKKKLEDAKKAEKNQASDKLEETKG